MRTASSSTTYVSRPTPQLPLSLMRAGLVMTGGVLVFFFLLSLLPAVQAFIYSGRIYPGVSVGGVDLSGLSQEEAAVLLTQRLDYPQRGRIVFQEGTQVWSATPGELGLFVDVQNSALAAYTVGRGGGLLEQLSARFQAWYSGADIPPLFVFDERIAQHYLEGIASQIDKPVVEASLSVNGVEVVVHPGQVGRTLDLRAALDSLQTQVQTMTDGILPLVVQETPPVILDASAQAEFARRILSAPLTIRSPESSPGDIGPWTFDPPALASMLNIERVESPEGAKYQVGLNSENLRTFLENIAPSFVRYPANARFIFNDETRQLELINPAVIGRALDVESSLTLINQKLAEGVHNVDLDLEYTNPAVTDDATAEELGISEAVSVYTSYFYGSSTARIQNIQIAAARFHGLLVPPNSTFSMAEALGDVSLDNGYAEALIIYGDRTIKGVGGGVCQVSTTLFRTVFFGGFPVVERYAHAYRVSYYEQTPSGGIDSNLAGLDATVFAPVVDFKFTNDTPYWLLMETYVSPEARTITWKFYSTSDGRSVEWDTSGPANTVEPPEPLYEENPELAPGEIKQVDWEAEGADVTVTRTVYRDGQVYFSDDFFTHYLPWRAMYQYGPGTEIPTPEAGD